MGREQKRKELKKYRHNKDLKQLNNNNNGIASVGATIKIIVVVVLILLVLYYGMAIFVTKEIDLSSNNDSSATEANDDTSTSVSNKILAANTFRQTEEMYYVYYYDFDDEENEIRDNISKLTDYKIYRVDTGSSLNTNYVVSDSGNKDAKVLEDLKVINPTLIKVSNDNIIEYYEGVDSIVDFINK